MPVDSIWKVFLMVGFITNEWLDHSYYKNLQQIKRACKHLIHMVEKAMNDEECGYTVNRIDEYENEFYVIIDFIIMYWNWSILIVQ